LTASRTPSARSPLSQPSDRRGQSHKTLLKAHRWLELSVACDREGAEAAAELFRKFGGNGVAIEGIIDPSLEMERLSLDDCSGLVVRTFLPLNGRARKRRGEIELRLKLLSLVRPLSPLSVREVAQEDWEHAWKEFFPVLSIGRIVIKPTWRDYHPGPDEIVVELDPGMAFGTGLHPTTQSCLKAIERHHAGNATALDLGTGSGILAIAMAKLGARKVMALDTDPLAVRVCRTNVIANGVKDIVTVRKGSAFLIKGDGLYDLIVANISSRVLIELAPRIAPLLTKGGTLILSGFLDSQKEATLAPYKTAGLQEWELIPDADWCTSILRAPSDNA